MKSWLALLALLLVPCLAAAHGRSVSYSNIEARADGASIVLRMTRLDRDALSHTTPAAVSEFGLSALLRLRAASGPCLVERGSFRELDAPVGFSRFEWRVRCSAEPTTIESELLFPIISAHLHFAHLSRPGQQAVELLLTEDRPRASFGAAATANSAAPLQRWQTLGRYFLLGVRHIASGWDHLAFLFALVLLARSFAAVAAAATGFTAGHSLTLALAALGVLRPDAAEVEALVALSIVLLAIENVWLVGDRRQRRLPVSAVAALLLLAMTARLWHRPAHLGPLALLGFALLIGCHYAQLGRSLAPFSSRSRAAVAGMFGLVHGFAFAAVLQEAALPTSAILVRLLGFNLGVEAGQLALLGGALACFRLLGGPRLGRAAARTLVQVGSAAAAAAGTYWLVVRGF